MENNEICWCRELYGLPKDFTCKKYECGRYRLNIRKLENEKDKDNEKVVQEVPNHK